MSEPKTPIKRTPEELVSDHRSMVALTGKISDFQLENLKAWPFVVLGDYISKTSVKYDFTKINGSEDEELCAGWVVFNFITEKKLNLSKEEIKKRLEQLNLWTKYLFWENTEVSFEKNGKKWVI